jgi:hypothetical protein
MLGLADTAFDLRSRAARRNNPTQNNPPPSNSTHP